MKLKFVFNKEYDKQTAKKLLVLKRYTKEDVASIDRLYKESNFVLKLARKRYQKSWDEINNDFFKLIEKITGYRWAYPNYECIISVLNPGVSNHGGSNKIMLWWKFNEYFMRRIAAHELIEHHYYEIYNKHYKKEKLIPGQVWALSEIVAYTLTSLPKEVKKFWSWHINYMESYLPGTAYPQLDELRKKLKKPFLKSKSFDDYIKKGIKLVKKYPKIRIKR